MLQSKLQDTPRHDLGSLQTACRHARRRRSRERREHFGNAAAGEALEFNVDQAEDNAGRRYRRIPFDGDAVLAGIRGEEPRRPARPGKRFAQPRQGFGDRGEKCQRNDRPIVHGSLDDRAQRAGVASVGELEQGVRTRRRFARSPLRRAPFTVNDLLERGAPSLVEFAVEAKGPVSHARFIVSRCNRAILRLAETRQALVVSTGKNSAWISVDGESGLRIAQLRRMPRERFMPVPGDVVQVRILQDGHAVVERIEPRGFTLERRSAGGRSKTMAANVDLLVTVTALANPAPRLVTLDQLLAFAETEAIEAAVVLTKPDLGDPAAAAELQQLYGDLHYSAVVINPKSGENVDALRAIIRDRRALLAG